MRRLTSSTNSNVLSPLSLTLFPASSITFRSSTAPAWVAEISTKRYGAA